MGDDVIVVVLCVKIGSRDEGFNCDDGVVIDLSNTRAFGIFL